MSNPANNPPLIHNSTSGPVEIGPGGAGQTIADLIGEDLAAARDVRHVYLHVPYCFHKCHYCDFYSVVDTSQSRLRFVNRLIEEIRASCPRFDGPVESLYVGGGTPTLLEAAAWRDLLGAIVAHVPLAGNAEFTVEANPETVTAELASILVSGGVNRISLGAQSFNRLDLAVLQRQHEPEKVGRGIEIFRDIGLTDISLDLIFAIPGQTLDGWLADLDRALALEPDHLSCYGLTYEEGTPLTAAVEQGRTLPVDEDVEAEMYEAAMDRLAAAGMEHYEISNWARPGHRCRHNLAYWENRDYWPLGPAAAGHLAGLRWKNLPDIGRYLEGGPLPVIADVETPDDDRRAGEELMLGLRQVEGLAEARVGEIFVLGARGREREAAIGRNLQAGLLTRTGDRLRLTRRGLLLADTVLAELV